ncbi:MAG: hypothetical protein UY63_C0016G0011 [Parcubacteria group bacterium GW2011_GWA2_51_10]|nr:MAG: hypothetical protein UY63_C0016G0011 [Parcubacteria group bacterium GW2011_GWA2_51_10]
MNKRLLIILAAAIIVRLFLFGFLYVQNSPEFFVLGDSNGYLRIANNIALGNGFTQATEPPYLPDSMRVPLFPAVLAASLYIFGSYLPVIFLQIFLSAIIVYFTYRFTFLITEREKLALVAAGLMAFEPYSIFISTSVLTETLFTALLVAGAYMAARFTHVPAWRPLAAASALFGFAALVRPIGEFLPLILIVLVMTRMPAKQYGKYLALAVIPFLIVVGPWLARNQLTFGVPALSSGGLQNAYSDLAGAVVAYRDRISWPEAKQKLEEDFARRHEFDVAIIQQDLSKSPELFKEGIGIMLAHPKYTALVAASIALTFFTNDAWTYYLQRWEILPRYDITFSPTYTLVTEGPAVAARKIIENTGPTLLVPLIGRLFWVAVSMLFFIGIGALMWQGGKQRLYGTFLLLLVLYFLALSSSVGLGINGRFRYPVHSFFFTAAAVGGSVIVNWIRQRVRVLKA